jgi:hypothetical protein
MSINTQDENQREKFNNLKALFPSEDLEKLTEEMIEEMTVEFDEMAISYSEDIEPLLADSFRVMIGLAGNFENEKEDPDVYVALTIGDKEKAEALIDKVAESNEDATKSEIFGYPALDNEEEEMYLVLYKDTVLVTSTQILRHDAVKRMKNNEESLRSNENFIKTLESLPTPNLGYAYIDIQSMFTKIGELEEEIELPIADSLYAEAFAFMAEDDGVRMLVQVAFNPDAETFNFADFPYKEPYLYKQLPGDDLVMYSESYDIQTLFDLEMEVLLIEESDKEDFEEFKVMLKQMVGLDLEKDILSWMDKGYALVIQRNKGIVPGISLYVDASSDSEGAKKVVDVFDAALAQFVEGMIAEAPEGLDASEIIKKEVVEVGDSELNRVQFDFTNLTEEQLFEAGLPQDFFIEPMELYYGITSDNYFVLSTRTDLAADFESGITVAENEKIIEAQTYLNGYPYQLTYISIEEIAIYVDTFIGLMEKIEGPMPEESKEAYEKVMKYIAPIKYLVGANKKVENIVEGMMFIKMN